jgi:CBS domain containing-hemolysin-like protein
MNDDPSRPGTEPHTEHPTAPPEAAAGGESHASVTDWLKGLFGRGTESEPASANGRNGPEDPFAARPEASSMMRNLLEFVDLRVEDVMVPRAEIVAIDEDASVHDLLRRFMEANHSRLPVYRETLDDPVGMVHIKDFLRWLTERSGAKEGGTAGPGVADELGEAAVALPEADLGTTVKQTGILRPLLFVPPSMRAADLLVKMQSTRGHMAIVVDEYGGTDGLVSIEDLVEEIVGDIADEHEEDEAELINRAEEGVFLADARAPIEDVEEALGLSLLPEEREEDADSLGGLIVSMLGRVPVRGELLRHPAGIELEILEADPRRVKKIRIHTRPKPQRQRRKETGGQG